MDIANFDRLRSLSGSSEDVGAPPPPPEEMGECGALVFGFVFAGVGTKGSRVGCECWGISAVS